jgi:hypothetical protein
MKTKKIIISISILLIVCFGTITPLLADETYDLNGEWNAVINIITVSGRSVTGKDIIIISQQGNQFVGTRTIGSKFIGKNEKEIKGKLVNRMVDEVFVRYVHDPITFDLSWSEGRATITEKGNKTVIQSYIPSIPEFKTITLTRK